MQEEEFCLEALKKTQEEQYPVFKPAILSDFQIAAHTFDIFRENVLPIVPARGVGL